MLLEQLFPLVPMTWFYVVIFGFGIIVGSFLNVLIYRFHTGKSLAGHSHCLSCGKPLRWYELFPLFSYLALRGKCSGCGCRIPARYFLVELATGLLFVGALSITTHLTELVIWCAIFSVLLVITVYDLYHFIIPDSLTITLTALALALFFHDLDFATVNLEYFGFNALTAFLGSLFFLFLWIVSGGRWLGFGDVKLAFPLGFLVGPPFVFSFVVLSFWVGAIISLGLLAATKWGGGKAGLQLANRTLTIKSAVPFAPFLVASCIIIIFTNFNALELFSFK